MDPGSASKVKSSLEALSSELTTLGYTGVGFSSGDTGATLEGLVNTFRLVAGDLKTKNRKINRLTEEAAKLRSDLARAQSEKLRASKEADGLRSEIGKLNGTVDRLNSLLNVASSDKKRLGREVSGLKSEIDGQRAYFEHDVKRLNTLVDGLRGRLERDFEGPRRTLAQTSNSPDGINPSEEAVNTCIAQLYSNTQTLIEESALLRNCLFNLCKRISRFKPDDPTPEHLYWLPHKDIVDQIEQKYLKILNNISLG